MHVGTIASQKYFNGIAPTEQTLIFKRLLTQNFKEAGTLAFGQMKFIVNNDSSCYDWKILDNFVDFAQKNKLNVHYNTVINNKNSFPDWYWKLSPTDKVKSLEAHIRKVLSRYKGKFYLYKLVNEMVRDDEANFLGTNTDRTDLIAKMFQWAKEEDPDALLMINDFAVFVRDDIRKAYIEMINKILEKGGPIDVIGEQGHLGHPSPYKTPVFQLPTDEMLNLALDEIHSSTKLPIYVTEFDISYDNSPLDPYDGSKIDPKLPFTDVNGEQFKSWYLYQAYAYKHFYEVCQVKNFVQGLIFWGFYDGDTLKNERPGTGFFDSEFAPKPVYEEMKTRIEKC